MADILVKTFEDSFRREMLHQHEQWRYLLDKVFIPFWTKHAGWVNQHPRLKGLMERVKSTKYKHSLRDVAFVYAITLSQEDFFAAFREFLDPESQKILDHLVWVPKADEYEIEDQLDIKTTYVEDKGNYFGQRKHLKEKFMLFPFDASHGWQAIFTHYLLYFPHEVRIHLMEYYEKPAGFYIQEVKELPQNEELSIFEDKGQILTEIPLIDIYHKQGNIKTGKSGKPHANTYTGMRKKLGIREFYPSKDAHKIIQNLRTSMLANLWVTMSEKRTAKDAGLQLLKRLFDQYYFRSKFNHHFLLLHLNGLTNVYGYGVTPFEQIFKETLKDIPLNQWIDIENIYSWLHYRGYKIAAVDYYNANQYLSYSSNYMSSSSLGHENYRDIVEKPSLYAYFFLYGAYGLFDIAYETPNTKRPGITCTSPFDGLKYVRLNPLGAYIFGITSHYEVVNTVEEGIYELSPNNLIIRVSANSTPDKADRLVNFATSLGNLRFKVNHESFLKNCQTKEDIQAQIVLFRQLIDDKPPKIWEDFFEDVLSRVSPLETIKAVKVFKLPQNPELLRLIAQDPKLQTIISKAENYQIIIKEKDLPTLKSRLKTFGYLM